ncbi:MAG: riboflavin biosynthesis protein RibF [Ruminococcus sp.]|nr:riboflavin biosynthesis protein RibF [Ruminococcus sp.]
MTELTENDVISEKTAVALGIFDGLHHGHRAVLSEILSCEAPTVFTFRTESIKKKHGKPFEYIYSNSRKLELFAEMGIKYVYSPDFDHVKDMSGEEFVREILVNRMNAELVVCGENFRFGRAAGCGTAELTELGGKYGFKVKVIGLDGFSSEKYRSLLREGSVDELRKNNDAYIISAEVTTGNMLGRTIDFPTINQNFALGQLVPRHGVYRSRTTADGKIYDSVTNVGVKPTVEDNIKPLAETHILGFSGNLYGSRVQVELCEFVRDEMRFSSVDELKKQIESDVKHILNQTLNI